MATARGRSAVGVPTHDATKLVPPMVPAHAVHRRRLITRLDAGRPLVRLVVGPPGAGKSVLAASWLQQRPELPTAWVRLDTTDDDPARFWGLLAEAARPERFGSTAPTRRPVEPEGLVAAAGAACRAATGEPLHLVIEDVHCVCAPGTVDRLSVLLDQPERPVVATLLSRSDPALPLARWRARGDLTEVRGLDLRFTTTEADELFWRLGCRSLSAGDVQHLVERTEGWVTGLQLAAIAARHAGAGPLVERFDGSVHGVFDFLFEEVLELQPPDIQSFLLATCVLDELSAPLCDAITGRDDSARVLAHLEASQLFVVPVGGRRGRHRYHRLFAEMLRHELRLHHPSVEETSHRVASRWYEDFGRLEDALDHAAACGGFDLVIEILQRRTDELQTTGRWGLLRRWIDAIPEDYVAQHPEQSRGYASLLAAVVAPVRAERWAALGDDDPGRERTALRATIALGRAVTAASRGGDVAGAELVDGLSAEPDADPAVVRLAHVWNYRLAVFAERFDDAAHHLPDVVRAGEADPELYVDGLTALGAWSAGDLVLAERLAERALDRWWVRDAPPQIGIPDALLARAAVHVEHADVAAATALLAHPAVVGAVMPVVAFHALAAILEAQVARLLGDPARAVAILEDERRVGGPAPGTPLHGMVGEDLVAAALECGDVRRAERTLTGIGAPGAWARSRCRVELAKGSPDDAAWALQHVHPATTRRRVDVALLEARAARGDPERCRAHVLRALALGLPEGYRATFAREVDLRHVYDELEPTPALREVVAMVHAVDARLPAAPLERSLSERETAVLRLLVTHLSNREIARELFVSQNTVKTHIRSLYRKLGAGSRSEAVREARRHGLIGPDTAVPRS